MRPHRQQPTRLCHPWNSPGKNTGVGCHFLLHCVKVKVKLLSSDQLVATPWNAAHQAPPSMGFSRQEYWSGLPLNWCFGNIFTCVFFTHEFGNLYGCNDDGRESEWTLGVGDGQGGLACCDSWGRKELDTTERLNWTELNCSGILGLSQWHPTPVLLPGKSHGWRSLVGCSPWGWEELDTTEQLPFHFSLSCTGEGMATHSSVLAWRIPGMAEPGGLPSVGSHRVGHNWSDLAAAAADTVQRTKFPGGLVVKTLCSQLRGAQVQFLVRELDPTCCH